MTTSDPTPIITFATGICVDVDVPIVKTGRQQITGVTPTSASDPEWEYGFYDSEDAAKTIWWYVFGMSHKTAESARHTASKNVWGEAVIVRRHPGETEWEHVEEESDE